MGNDLTGNPLIIDTAFAAGEITQFNGPFHFVAGNWHEPTAADDLTIENSSNAGLSILTPNTDIGGIYFGDPDDNDIGQIKYQHSTDNMTFVTGASVRFRIGGSGKVYINESANAGMTVGLTIHQGTADNEIIAFKSEDVIHYLTSEAESDTWGAIRKANASYGGMNLLSLCEHSSAVATVLESWGGIPNTNKTAAGAQSLVEIEIGQTDGAGNKANITANGNIFAVKARVGGSMISRAIVDEDGDFYCATSHETLDAYDDLALVNAYDQIRSEFGMWVEEEEETLMEIGVLGGPIADGGMTNVTQLQRLHNGALRQVAERLERIEAALIGAGSCDSGAGS
jgi:hypothetical protein